MQNKRATNSVSWNEFHINRTVRDALQFGEVLYASNGNAVIHDIKTIRLFAQKYNDYVDAKKSPEKGIFPGELNAMGLIDEIFHYCAGLFRKTVSAESFNALYTKLNEYAKTSGTLHAMLADFCTEFPPRDLYQSNNINPDSVNAYLAQNGTDEALSQTRSNLVCALEEVIMLHMANENPAFRKFLPLFDEKKLAQNPFYNEAWSFICSYFAALPVFGPKDHDFITFLHEPIVASPNSLQGQLDYILKNWADLLGDWLKRLLAGIDMMNEEFKPAWQGMGGGLPPMDAYDYSLYMNEYEAFSDDKDWMPRVVMLAKTTLVWLSQLSRAYGHTIATLDQIPDQELDRIRHCGFNSLWLIGLWERSKASSRIKHICGNPEAAASAYSLFDYEIAWSLGGWGALENLRHRCSMRGIKLAADMVPNHTGMDSKWVVERPDVFMQRFDCPFPHYSFNGENLSQDGRVSIFLEDHYYSKTDCAVFFKRVDNGSGETRYIFHGNDGTGLPWNDTAQIDFLNPAAREEVIQKILHVARNFQIIRFDAAMVLAKKHIKRLWFPEPGRGGDIPSRSENALSADEFNKAIPEEFWREVVNRCAKETPETLLLAEAFWMMEGYFVRTLGMHRVYNSAFMNMLKKEENYKYKQTIKNTIEFDPQVLKRFVNFMNNPDEETAIAQFGDGDKYFGVATLLVTMPGLPMFGHGQIEGFTEKYGMEFTRDYKNETPNQWLIDRHEREIFPLMRKRYLFSGIENFLLFDFWAGESVNENVFAYSNRYKDERTLVLYNNVYASASGWVNRSAPFLKDGSMITRTLGEGLGLHNDGKEFCILHELRSQKWFIRSSSDMCQNGLFATLSGFGCQVFDIIYPVVDDESGKWALLNHTLAGSPCDDINEELMNVFLKDLYATFVAFTDALYPDATDAVDAKKRGDGKQTPAALEKAGKAFFAKFAEYAGVEKYGAAKAVLPFATCAALTGKTETEVVISSAKMVAATKAQIDAAWKNFSERKTAFDNAAPKDVAQKTESKAKSQSKAKSEILPLYENVSAVPAWKELIIGYAALWSAAEMLQVEVTTSISSAPSDSTAPSKKGAAQVAGKKVASEKTAKPPILTTDVHALSAAEIVALLDAWTFGTKLCRITDTKKIAPFAQTFSSRISIQEALLLPPTVTAGNAATALFASKNARITMGLNEYNGVRWFNKELSDAAFSFAAIVPAVVSNDFAAASLDAEKRAKALFAARDKSEYKADAFLASFTSAQKKAHTEKASEKAAPQASAGAKAKKGSEKK